MSGEQAVSFDHQRESLSLGGDVIKDLECRRHSLSLDKDDQSGIEYADTGLQKSSTHRKVSGANKRRGSQQSITDVTESGNPEIRCKSGSQKKRLSIQETDIFNVQLKRRDADKKAGEECG